MGDRDDRGGRWRVAVPMWAIVMIAVVAGLLLLCCLFCMCKRCLCKKRKVKEGKKGLKGAVDLKSVQLLGSSMLKEKVRRIPTSQCSHTLLLSTLSSAIYLHAKNIQPVSWRTLRLTRLNLLTNEDENFYAGVMNSVALQFTKITPII